MQELYGRSHSAHHKHFVSQMAAMKANCPCFALSTIKLPHKRDTDALKKDDAQHGVKSMSACADADNKRNFLMHVVMLQACQRRSSSALFPAESSCSILPSSIMLQVSKPLCGWSGNPAVARWAGAFSSSRMRYGSRFRSAGVPTERQIGMPAPSETWVPRTTCEHVAAQHLAAVRRAQRLRYFQY